MTAIERILSTGESARSGDEAIPTEQEIREVERELNFRFPASYLEFVRLGGLGELCMNNPILSPAEVLESRHYLPDSEHVPFADNGCGDLYCWPRSDAAEPVVLFADHETSYTYREVAASFTQWLAENKS